MLDVVPYKSNVSKYAYNFMLNGIEVGWLIGQKHGDTLTIVGIKIENEYRNKGLGEKFLIEYLKKYGGYILSNTNRTDFAEKMWQRLSKRNDVNVNIVGTETHPYYKKNI